MNARIDKLEKQIEALIELNNRNEDELERTRFDIRFIRAWMKEHIREGHGPQNTERPA